jgi:hypothetical protein
VDEDSSREESTTSEDDASEDAASEDAGSEDDAASAADDNVAVLHNSLPDAEEPLHEAAAAAFNRPGEGLSLVLPFSSIQAPPPVATECSQPVEASDGDLHFQVDDSFNVPSGAEEAVDEVDVGTGDYSTTVPGASDASDEFQHGPEFDSHSAADEDDSSGDDQFLVAFLSTAVKHHVSMAAAEEILSVIKLHLPRMSEDLPIPSYKWLLLGARAKLPLPKLDVHVWDNVAEQELIERGLCQYPKKKYKDRTLYTPVMVRTYYTVAQLTTFAQEIHRGSTNLPDFKAIQLSLDGVPESKSNGTKVSLEVVSLRFRGCHKIFPLSIIRLTEKGHQSLSAELILRPIIDEIKELALKVDYIVADKPERSLLRNQKGHSSYLGCDFCTAVGMKLTKRRTGATESNPENVNTGVFYPVLDEPRELRRIENVRYIMCNYEALNASDRTQHQASMLGYKGPSPILELCEEPHNFNFFLDIPAEYMHCICLGVVKQLYDKSTQGGKTFNPGMMRRIREQIAKEIRDQKLPSSFSRRARSDFPQYKASEWRNLGIVFFPLMQRALNHRSIAPRSHLWLLLGYILRAHLLDEDKFRALVERRRQLNMKPMRELCKLFATTAVEAFSESFLTYNVHVFTEHLTMMREHRPLTEGSAFEFESSYSLLLRSFKVGTTSGSKQALQNILLTAKHERHQCEKSYLHRFGLRDTSVTTDMLVVSKQGDFYQLTGVEDDGTNDSFLALKIELEEYSPRDCPEEINDFASVEVYKYLGLSETCTRVCRSDLKTFAVLLKCEDDDVILSVPEGTLLHS